MVVGVLRAALCSRNRGAVGRPFWARLLAAPVFGGHTGSWVLKWGGSAGAARLRHLWFPRIWNAIWGWQDIFFLGPSHHLRLARVGFRRPAKHKAKPGATSTNAIHDLNVTKALS